MKYCVCTDALYMGKGSIYNAVTELNSLGLHAYEFWFWWEKDLDVLKQTQDKLGVACVAICAKFLKNPGDPAEQADYLADFRESVEAAKKLGCSKLIVQAGWEKEGLTRELHRKTLLDTLTKASDIAADDHIVLLVEPLNIKVDHPGYHLWDTEDAFDVIRTIGRPNVKLLFDIYHQQISCGNIIDSITRNLDLIGHIHCAGVPGRHEICDGELYYKHIFAALKASGYQEYIGLEYFTDVPTADSIRESMKQFVY